MTIFSEISEIPASNLPWLDEPVLDHTRVSRFSYATELLQWRNSGVVILPGFIPQEIRELYFQKRAELNNPKGYMRGAYTDPCPYLYVPEMRALSLYPPLLDFLDELIGYKMGLHLNLTGWVSTERAWHQDDYLNPDFVNSHYAAVWFALRDVDPDCGPFEYVPGSHKWPLTRREKVLALHPGNISVSDPDWPTKTQDWISQIFQQEIVVRQARAEKFMAKAGDVLIWHGRLAHRGSVPQVPGTPRYSLIAHYSAIQKRTDMLRWKDRCFLADREGEWKD